MQLTTINGKYEIILPDHRAARPDWYTETGWEKIRLESMRESIKPGDVVYYIGSEEAEMAALCQMWGAKVVMVEPNPKVWPNALAIWNANGMETPLGYFVGFASNETNLNPRKLDFKVGDKDGWPLCAYGEVISNHGFRELKHQTDATPQIKIDDMPFPPPTMISIDVEGSEWFVLKGAEQTLLKHRPIIFLSGHPEFMALMFGEYLTDVRNWVKDRGYKEELLCYDHEVHFKYTPV